MRRALIVIGSGGHASVVADALLSAGEALIGFTDVDPARHGVIVCGYPVLGDDTILSAYHSSALLLANGIGTVGGPLDHLRRTSQQRLTAAGWEYATIRHPAAVVSRFASVHPGAQLFANSVLQAGAVVGVGAIVNTAAIVEHDTIIGDWSHLAPGAVVCGGASIGHRSFVGAGAVVRHGLCLAEDMVVAAGAVVVRNFPTSGTIIGVPARLLSTRK